MTSRKSGITCHTKFSNDQLTQVLAAAAPSLPAVLGGPGGVGEPVLEVSGSQVRI